MGLDVGRSTAFSGAQIAPSSELEGAIGDIDSRLDYLADRFNDLEQRLLQVQKPVCTDSENLGVNAKSMVEVATAPVVEKLRNQAMGISKLTSRIDDLLKRIVL